MKPRSSARTVASLAQIAAALPATAAIALFPPANGRVLLVPLTMQAAHALPVRALADGALLIGGGPLAGSLVVETRDASLWRDGVLALAAPGAGCASRGAAVVA